MSTIGLPAALVFLFWAVLFAQRTRRFPSDHFLQRAAEGTAGSVVAIVPARNEAEVLRDSLSSLLAQDHPEFRVVLVDDNSTDGTSRVASEIGAASEVGMEVVAAGHKPAGWAGKVFAQSRGLAHVLGSGPAPDWLLLTDADIRHPPDSVTSLLAKARRGGYDLVSVMARLHAASFFERLLIPPFVYFFHL
ncbi:MAG: glycosyltransferase family 2 protein, partial [Acidobacteriota bacterium]|nr:glycosyltransferase family 2 protein [Acidobacteriota bacterium]